jgi:predicted ABC-type ATPase
MHLSPTFPDLVALAGPNGAGKSTVGPALLRDSLGIATFVNADVIAQGLSGLEPEGAAFEAGRIMLERIDELARRRVSFAFETTLAGRAYARRIAALVEQGYRFHIVYLWLDSPQLAVARVQDRVRAGGHAVPETVVRRRYRAGLRNFFELYRPLATSWQMHDNSTGGQVGPRLIARGRYSSVETVLERQTWAAIEGSIRRES